MIAMGHKSRRFAVQFLILFPALFISSYAASQTGRVPKYNVRVDIVSIDVEVLDESGNPVPDLMSEDFHVKENGREVEIVNFSHVHDKPVSLAIVLDTSTIEQKKLTGAKQFILNIIYLLAPSDDICVYSFDKTDAILEVDFTADRNEIVDALENIGVSSRRKWGFLAELFGFDPPAGRGVDLALRSLRGSAHARKVLLVVSNRFRGLGPATVDHLRESRCVLFTLGFDNEAAAVLGFGDRISRNQLVDESGGRKFSAETDEVMDVSRSIVRSMKQYYSLGYRAGAGTTDTEKRNIEVRISGGEYTVHTRRTITGRAD